MPKVVSLVEPPFLFWFRKQFAQPLRPFPGNGSENLYPRRLTNKHNREKSGKVLWHRLAALPLD